MGKARCGAVGTALSVKKETGNKDGVGGGFRGWEYRKQSFRSIFFGTSSTLSYMHIFPSQKITLKIYVLAGVAQWIERWPANQGVAGSMPSRDTCLGCRPGAQ